MRLSRCWLALQTNAISDARHSSGAGDYLAREYLFQANVHICRSGLFSTQTGYTLACSCLNPKGFASLNKQRERSVRNYLLAALVQG